MNGQGRRLCVAPMMDRTDRHFRYLMRLVAPGAYLYTEMVTAAALVRGDTQRWLRHDPAEHPVGFQLGGSVPQELAVAARLVADAGFDEVNLNVGCPSDRVQAGRFGAALMLERELVADAVTAMSEVVDVPVTVKTRLGVDDSDDYDFLCQFAEAVIGAGCRTLIVHARKAWLHGLSPKQNREIPPLDYSRVYRLKDDFQMLEIIINGGIRSADDAARHLERVDGVMLGRAAYDDPMVLAEIDGGACFSGHDTVRARVLEQYLDYLRRETECGTRLKSMTRHLTGMFHGEPGARQWRRDLGELDDGPPGIEKLRKALLQTGPRTRPNFSERNRVYTGDRTGYNAAIIGNS